MHALAKRHDLDGDCKKSPRSQGQTVLTAHSLFVVCGFYVSLGRRWSSGVEILRETLNAMICSDMEHRANRPDPLAHSASQRRIIQCGVRIKTI